MPPAASTMSRCEPCKQTFTTQRAYLRHRRESLRHRGPSDPTGRFTCEECPETFGRAFDRERHRKAKHLDRSSIRGSSCDASRPTHLTCEKDTEIDSRLKSAAWSELTALSLNIEFQHTCKRRLTLDPRRDMLERLREDDSNAFFPHLEEYFEALTQTHRCHACETEFLHAVDLEDHLRSAQAGKSGFSYRHVRRDASNSRPDDLTDHHFLVYEDEQSYSGSRLRQPGHIGIQASAEGQRAMEVVSDIATLPQSNDHTATAGISRLIKVHSGTIASRSEAAGNDCGMEAVITPPQSPKSGFSPLQDYRRSFWYGIMSGSLPDVKLAAQQGVDINREMLAGFSGLHIAIFAGSTNSSTTTYLLENTTDLNLRDLNGRTPLMHAIRCDRPQVVTQLLRCGADIRVARHRALCAQTALHYAISLGRSDCLSSLLTHHGIKDTGDIPDSKGRTLLRLAVELQRLDLIRLLLCAGAKARHEDLFYAAANEDGLETMQLLLYFGAPSNPVNDNGASALVMACSKGNIAAIRLLIERGADVNHTVCVKWAGRSIRPLESACGNVEILKFLLAKGADLLPRDAESGGKPFPALLAAVRCGHVEAVQFLVAAVPLEQAYFTYPALLRPALCYAAQLGHLPIVRILIQSGAHLNQRCNCDWMPAPGHTPLMSASYADDLAVSRYLLSCNVDVDCEDEHGCTALCRALEFGDMERGEPGAELLYAAGGRLGTRCGCAQRLNAGLTWK